MRTREDLYRHYQVERELAARLRSAGREERRRLYGTLYDELFERVPDHPQLSGKVDYEHRRRFVEIEMGLLDRFLYPDTTFMEIGCGDCALSYEAAKRAGRVYGVDVSRTIAMDNDVPGNFDLLISDGIGIEVPEESVDVAYSRQLIEHLHPDDVIEHVMGVFEALKPGGIYICMTPHRHAGPHDISKFFEREASGFHLHEYTHAEVVSLLRRAGFGRIRLWKRLGSRYIEMPLAPPILLEKVLEPLHYRTKRAIARLMFGMIRLIAEKP